MTEENKKSSLFSVQGLYKQMRSFVEIYLEPTSQNLNKKQKTKMKTKKEKEKKICKKCGHHKCSHHEKHKKNSTEEMTTTHKREEREEEMRKRMMERRIPISKFDKNPYERNVIDEHEQTHIKKMDVEYRLSDDMMSFSPHYRKEEENEYKRNIEMKMEEQSLETENISEWNHRVEMKIDEYEENDIYKMDIIDEGEHLENEDDEQSLEEDINCDCAYHRSLRERKETDKDMEILHEIDEVIY